MTVYEYAPSMERAWLAIATDGHLLVVKVGEDDELAESVLALDLDALAVQDVLDVLTADGLAATPSFVMMFSVPGDLADNGLGVIVRGEAVAMVSTDDGETAVRPVGVTSWAEHLIDNVTGFEFVAPDEEQDDGALVLPLGNGAAWISRIALAEDLGELEDEQLALDEQGDDADPEPIEPPAPPIMPQAEEVSDDERVVEETQIPDFTVVMTPDQSPVMEPAAFAEELVRVGDSSEIGHPSDSTILRDPGPYPAMPSRLGESTLGDHDGLTVLAEDVRAARTAAFIPESAPQQFASFNYVLELPGGGRQSLETAVVLGRAPSVTNVPASVLPRLVTLVGDDISRNHVRVAVEGDAVVVTDLHSSNGTQIIGPGMPPQLLRGGEPTPVIAGTIIDLGSGVTLRVTEA